MSPPGKKSIYPPDSFHLSLGEDGSWGLNFPALLAWKPDHPYSSKWQEDILKAQRPAAISMFGTSYCGIRGRLNGFRQGMGSTRCCHQFYGEFLSIAMSPTLIQASIPSYSGTQVPQLSSTYIETRCVSKYICGYAMPTNLKPFCGLSLVPRTKSQDDMVNR